MPTVSRGRRWPKLDVSFCLLVGMHLSVLFVFLVPFSWWLIPLALGSYLLRMFAITAGYHRYFSHRSFSTSRLFQLVLATLGTASMQNGPLWWASWHRFHHKHADTPTDPHSPDHMSFWHSHLGWVLDGTNDHPNLANIKDLTRFPELRFLDRHKWLPLITYAVGCFLIGSWSGLVWGFVVSTIALFHATCLINSLAHVWGNQPHETGDSSRNNPLLALVTLGEGWHNNHHRCMTSARQGFKWWEVDLTFYVLVVLERLGIISERSRATTSASVISDVMNVSYVLSFPMTVGFVPAFETKIDATFDGDGASIFHHAAVLDTLAEEHGFPLLTSFADDREPPPDFDGNRDELIEAIGPWTAWFSSDDGLRCVEGLLDVLDDPKTREQVTFVEVVIDDLTALRDVLTVAKKKKARFRLEIA